MRRSTAPLLVATIFALIVFAFNALPSTVILDDDTRLSPVSSQHRGLGTAVDAVLAVAVSLVALAALGDIYRPLARSAGALPVVASIARAPPARRRSY